MGNGLEVYLLDSEPPADYSEPRVYMVALRANATADMLWWLLFFNKYRIMIVWCWIDDQPVFNGFSPPSLTSEYKWGTCSRQCNASMRTRWTIPIISNEISSKVFQMNENNMRVRKVGERIYQKRFIAYMWWRWTIALNSCRNQ